MAGGILGSKKNDPKNKSTSNQLFSPEILKDGYSPAKKQENKGIFGLKGILMPGQSVEINKQKDSDWNKEFLPFTNHLENETKQLFEQKQQEWKKEIEELLNEIKKLAKATDNLERQVEIATEQPVVEVNTYQIGVLKRIKNLIAQFRLNVSQASNCLELFQSRKKKKNAFWNNVKSKKKGGGEQYLMSNEHSAARSAV